ncbi:MAG: GFOIDHMocA domain-containing protein [Nitrospira sp.]|nr:MAG: GFOIDHMocA domain-containing protein [Nitrospira sp.]
MKALVGGQWLDGFLDYHRRPGDCRLKVLACLTLTKVDALYFVRSSSMRLVWNYVREIGVGDVFRKIVSRRSERLRNEKYLSIGIGSVLDSGDVSPSEGQLVLFVAPAHPMCVERLVLPAGLVRPLEQTLPFDMREDEIVHSQSFIPLPACLEKLKGWSAFSGSTLTDLEPVFDSVLTMLMEPSVWAQARHLAVDTDVLPSERHMHKKASIKRGKSGVLFGYGNYAKVIVLPNIAPFVNISCIHEVDPLQIPLRDHARFNWDTADDLRTDEQYDAYFLAGFHHSHAPLAIKALQSDACAVVEKPLAVDSAQLSALIDTMSHSKGSLFSCFHKRYQPLNQYAIRDLHLTAGDPVSYHCIVYEVPLPFRHWYRWPNSKSRLVSNGCHWVDHFLFLNNYCEVAWTDLCVAGDGTINCSMQLHNEAFFTMVLTDQGSERIGVQDYIELRANGSTVRMSNGAVYEAECNDRILRKLSINKMESYRSMYRSIGQKIARGLPGDTIEAVRISTGAVLDIEKQFTSIIADRSTV